MCIHTSMWLYISSVYLPSDEFVHLTLNKCETLCMYACLHVSDRLIPLRFVRSIDGAWLYGVFLEAHWGNCFYETWVNMSSPNMFNMLMWQIWLLVPNRLNRGTLLWTEFISCVFRECSFFGRPITNPLHTYIFQTRFLFLGAINEPSVKCDIVGGLEDSSGQILILRSLIADL